jgi:putative transposase
MAVVFKNHNGVAYSCAYRVIWCSKYRRPVLEGAIAAALRDIVQSVCATRDAPISSLGIDPDQVTLQVCVDPQFGIHRLVKQIKAQSSHALRRDYPSLTTRLPTLWSNSYCVTTVTSNSAAALAQYLEDQRETAPVSARSTAKAALA